MTDFERIEKAIRFLKNNFKQQPELEEVAEHIHVSPFHFQRLFTSWAGVSPKKFLQYISIEHAKRMLQEKQALTSVSYETGLSGTGRLHDLFMSIEGMTPGEYKKEGEDLEIHYQEADTIFGPVMIASTPKGICHIAFTENSVEGFRNLQARFPRAKLSKQKNDRQDAALKIFAGKRANLADIKFHLKGTPFQLKVWEALLQIPFGAVESYQSIAERIESPTASRAVGAAIGQNPVAYLIPCHRVIKSTGLVGEYHWGSDRKTAILGWEAAQAGAV
jgi:AraC family transcriptional regulator, regulatory protein of adaptative response / methylated-DNA-[protein]-cysteine methyltransferase